MMGQADGSGHKVLAVQTVRPESRSPALMLKLSMVTHACNCGYVLVVLKRGDILFVC